MNYVDPVAFTGLFAQDWVANRPEISRQLHRMCQEAARGFVGRRHDLEDAASAAIVLALRKLHRFDHRRDGANAYSFFSTLILHAIERHLERCRHPEEISLHDLPLAASAVRF